MASNVQTWYRHRAIVTVETAEGGTDRVASFQDDSFLGFNRWLANAVEFYTNRMQYDNRVGHIAYVIDYRVGNEKAMVSIDSQGAAHEYRDSAYM